MGLNFDDLKGFSDEAKRQIITKMAKDGKAAKAPSASKYHAQPDTRGNLKFDSRKEARYFDELMIKLKAGEIRDLRLQPEFTLQEAYTTPEGERVRAIRYIADFSYERKTAPDTYGYEHWVKTVVDTKGVRTDVYKLKRKMFLAKYGYPITEV